LKSNGIAAVIAVCLLLNRTGCWVRRFCLDGASQQSIKT
jgi:hypothetical protein